MSEQADQTYTYSDNSYEFPDSSVETEVSESEVPQPNSRKFLPLVLLGILGIFLLGVLLFLLFGGKSAPTTTNDTTTPIYLQWWGVFLEPEVITPLLEKYKLVKPNVTIEYANQWRSELPYNQAELSYRTEINSRLSENDTVEIPDIFMVHNSWVGDYEKVTRASTSFDSTSFTSTFYPAITTDFVSGGLVRGVPLWVDDFAILYNKDHLNQFAAVSQPPTTWTDFEELAQKITTESNQEVWGFASGTGQNVSYAFALFNVLLKQNFVDIVDSAGNPIFANSPDTLSTLSFFQSFVDSNGGTWSTTEKNDSASFLEGNTSMIFAPSYRLREILKFNTAYQLNLDIGVAKVPQVAGTNINWVDYWGNMVALNRPNTVAAWEFLKWLTEPDQLKLIHEKIKETSGEFGTLYPRIDMAAELETDPWLSVYNQTLPDAQSWYMVKGLDVKSSFLELINSNGTASDIERAEDEIKALIANKGKL